MIRRARRGTLTRETGESRHQGAVLLLLLHLVVLLVLLVELLEERRLLAANHDGAAVKHLVPRTQMTYAEYTGTGYGDYGDYAP